MDQSVLDASPAAAIASGTERYEFLEMLGRGGMGEVWKAWDRELEMPVALKSLRTQIARDPRILARFRREARLARRIKHVNVAEVHDLVEIGGTRYLAMEHVDGKSLRGILDAKRSLPVHVALGFMRQVCSGVDAAHDAGVIHRDLKPHNIMVTRRHGRICILDFGIARELGCEDMTEVGVILGSPQYLSYEQLAGQPVTALSDIYQLGILLFELVTGVSPFRAPGAGTATLRALREVPPDPRQHVPKLPAFVAEAILRCLSKYPEDRFASALQLMAALEPPRGEALAVVPETLEMDSGEITLGGVPTALVAMADGEDRRLVADRLERLGCVVSTIADGQKAVEAAWSTAFSIVVVGPSLSGVDGLTALQILRRNPQSAATPIVMLVPSAGGGDAFARDAGATAVVESPLNVHAFARTVRELLVV
jgi:CheY-like chemotaxis protein